MPDTLPINTGAQPDAAAMSPSVTTPAQPGAYTGPSQKPGVVGGILKGVLSALSGGQTAQYTVDPNSGQVTQVPQHGETFRQMFGGILSGALEGLAGGFDKRPGESGGWAAAAARGFQARTQNLAQQDAVARQKAVQQFQMQQQAKSQQLEKQKEADTVRMEATKAQLMHENIKAEQMNTDKKNSESNYEANLSFFESLSKNGVPFTVSDIPGNDKSGNGGALMNIVSKYPNALQDANGDLRLPLRMEGPNGTAWKVIDIPASAKNQDVTVKLDPKLLKAAGVSVEGPMEQTMPLQDFMGIYYKAIAGQNQQALQKSEIDKYNAEADAARARADASKKDADSAAKKELISSLPNKPEVTHTAKKGGILGIGGGEQISTKGPEGKTISINEVLQQNPGASADQLRSIIGFLESGDMLVDGKKTKFTVTK